MAAAQVQRKLEFHVRKSSRLPKKTSNDTETGSETLQSGRRTRGKKCNLENSVPNTDSPDAQKQGKYQSLSLNSKDSDTPTKGLACTRHRHAKGKVLSASTAKEGVEALFQNSHSSKLNSKSSSKKKGKLEKPLSNVEPILDVYKSPIKENVYTRGSDTLNELLRSPSKMSPNTQILSPSKRTVDNIVNGSMFPVRNLTEELGISPRKRKKDSTFNSPDMNTSSQIVCMSPRKYEINSSLSDKTVKSPMRSPLLSPEHRRCLLGNKSKNSPIRRLLLSPERDDSSSVNKSKYSPLKRLLLSPDKNQSYQKDIGILKSPTNASQSSVRHLLHQSPSKSLVTLSPSVSHHVRQSPSKPLFIPSPSKQLITCMSPVKALRENADMVSVKSPSLLRVHRADCSRYQNTKKALHTAKPDQLIGRDKETAEIERFLRGHLAKGSSGSLYISGAPGTGKTAVLTHIIDSLNQRSEKKIKTVYLNCMTLKDSPAIFTKLASELRGKQTSCRTAKDAVSYLETFFTSQSRNVVLVLDEIDQLDSCRQEVLYTMFEWPALPKSRLILIGIANSLDLTDRILPRLQAKSTWKPRLLNFAPYSKDQIVAVIENRLHDLQKDNASMLDPSAVQFCARKVSALAGDMRKALDVCRRAVEMVEAEVRMQTVLKANQVCKSPSKTMTPNTPTLPAAKKINISHISKVVSEVYSARVSSTTSSNQQQTIPVQQKLVVCTLLLLLKQGRTKDISLGKLHETYSKMCKKRQVMAVDQSEFHSVCILLETRGILGLKKTKELRMSKISLRYDESEVEHALQDKLLMSSILKDGLP